MNIQELFKLAEEYLNKKDYAKAIEYFEQAAEQGDTKSKQILAYAYLQGKIVKQDPAKSFNYYYYLAEAGIKTAQNTIGDFYNIGFGVKKDYVKAFEFYQKAAEQGIDISKIQLGDCYLKGLGVKQDFEKAINYFREASERGPAESILYLAMCYCNGLGVEKNYAEAFNILTKRTKVRVSLSHNKSIYISLLNLLSKIKNNNEVLEIESIADLPIEPDNNIKLVHIIDSTQQSWTLLSNASVNGLYSVDKIYQCKSKIDQLLQKVENVKPDKSNEFEVFIKIYTILGKYITASRDDNNTYEESNLEGALLERTARCVGISETLRNMLSCKGIRSVNVLGNEHQYNQVCISGKWYYTDLSLDLPNIKNGKIIFNCLLSKDDFEKINPKHHIDQFGDIHPSLESYNQDYVQKAYQNVLESDLDKILQ